MSRHAVDEGFFRIHIAIALAAKDKEIQRAGIDGQPEYRKRKPAASNSGHSYPLQPSAANRTAYPARLALAGKCRKTDAEKSRQAVSESQSASSGACHPSASQKHQNRTAHVE
ncbi:MULTISPECIES: hypothetical protein [Pseudomonas syringae group]|uniref:hypothetical protein n=1 Tax=Pseudomonas syringae group TaxID=136849 RepID=UPI00287B7D12|nr:MULTISPECIES: hypothetical protein [Pseudomonas syringae group]